MAGGQSLPGKGVNPVRNYNELLRKLSGKVVLRDPEIPDRTLCIGDAEFLAPVAQVGVLRADYNEPDPDSLFSKDTLGGFEGFIGEGQAVNPAEVMTGMFNLGPALARGGAIPWTP
jgi:hypothetical protein